jgi:hypothetical protein
MQYQQWHGYFADLVDHVELFGSGPIGKAGRMTLAISLIETKGLSKMTARLSWRLAISAATAAPRERPKITRFSLSTESWERTKFSAASPSR